MHLSFICAAAHLALPASGQLLADGSAWHGGIGSSQVFALPAGSRPTFTWALPRPPRRGAQQEAFELEIFDQSGRSVWASGTLKSATAKFVYPSTAPILLPQRTYTWSVSASTSTSSTTAQSSFHIAPADADWHGVPWLGDTNLNVYRTSFRLRGAAMDAAARVQLYVCGLGFSVATLNGRSLNTLTTAPWTNSAKINGFLSVDITHALRRAGQAAEEGSNTLVVALGNGWRARDAFPVRDPADRGVAKDGAYPRMLRVMIVASLPDGSIQTVMHTGDGSWEAARGPVTYDSVYNGEAHDARIAEAVFAPSSSSWVQAPTASG